MSFREAPPNAVNFFKAIHGIERIILLINWNFLLCFIFYTVLNASRCLCYWTGKLAYKTLIDSFHLKSKHLVSNQIRVRAKKYHAITEWVLHAVKNVTTAIQNRPIAQYRELSESSSRPAQLYGNAGVINNYTCICRNKGTEACTLKVLFI